MKERLNQRILRVGIAILALGDGALHLLLNYVLFQGGGNRPPGPPPGATPGGGPPPGVGGFPFPLPLNQLFLLNFVGALVLALLFWFSRRLLGARRWLVDVALIGYAGVTFIAWALVGQPNPMGLGYLSKGIEIVLIVALIVDLWNIFRKRVSPIDPSAQT